METVSEVNTSIRKTMNLLHAEAAAIPTAIHHAAARCSEVYGKKMRGCCHHCPVESRATSLAARPFLRDDDRRDTGR